MERIRTQRTNPVAELGPWLTLASVLWIALAVHPAQAQFAPASYTVRVVDQHGRSLDGSLVRIEGATEDMPTPAMFTAAMGPNLFIIQPAFQGAMFPGGSLVPGSPNGLQRSEMIFLDPMGGDVTIEWQTADLAVSVADQNGAPIPGGTWGIAGGTDFYGAATLIAPITDEGVYPTLAGASVGGWNFMVRAAFDGNSIDLMRAEAREVDASTSALAFTWRQAACTMGVVDGTGAPIRGATWSMFGHTFAAGDAIVLPATEDGSGATLEGAYASGLPATLSTNTGSGDGSGTFEVLEDGTLAPAFIDINGATFGLRCGVSPFPSITTGTLAGTVLADGAPMANVAVQVADAAGGSTALLTDAAGGFALADVPQGVAVVTLTVPTGYHAVDPASGSRSVTIVAGESATADFAIAADIVPPPPPPPTYVNVPETWNYWQKEVRAALRNHGGHLETFKDMRDTYPTRIFEQFAQHPTDPVRVEGVTQVDPDGSGPKLPRRLDINDLDATIEPGNSTAIVVAKRELLVILLNVVSNRLSLNLPVDDQGTTLEQEIRRLADMINDGKPANDRLAGTRGSLINSGAGSPLVAARTGGYSNDQPSGGVVGDPASQATATGPRVAVLHDGYGSGVRVAFTLAQAGSAQVDVFDATGRHVERLWSGDAPAGSTIVSWNGGGRRGIYFARLVSAEGSSAAKFVIVP
jgi:hypothetical protein